MCPALEDTIRFDNSRRETDTATTMNHIGTLFIKIAAFCFIGAGAAVVSVGIPLIEYAQDERVLRYQVEEITGQEPSSEHCTADKLKDGFAECKTSLYMQSVLEGAKVQLNKWIQILTLLGIVSSILGIGAHLAFLAKERKRKNEVSG